jgi:hypothetical protein
VDVDLDTLDEIVCTILSGFLGPFAVVFTLVVMAIAAFYTPSARSIEFPATDTSEPLPGSEKDFKITLQRSIIAPGTLRADGTAGLVPDAIHAFVCLRLVTGLAPAALTPVSGATVELLELNSPAPAGDDVEIPATGDTERITKKFIIDESRSYEPLPDQSLGTRITDDSGFVRFVSRMRAAAGILTDITTTESIVSGRPISTRVKTDLIDEPSPDFAITVTTQDGTVLARRMLIALNNPGRKLGTPDDPLVVRLDPQTTLVAGRL